VSDAFVTWASTGVRGEGEERIPDLRQRLRILSKRKKASGWVKGDNREGRYYVSIIMKYGYFKDQLYALKRL